VFREHAFAVAEPVLTFDAPRATVMPVSRLAPLLVGIVVLSALVAQDRGPAFLLVTDANGKPVADARVTCFAPPELFASGATNDVVEVTSDARGRALPRLLPARTYSAFATVSGSGLATRVSAMHESLSAGSERTLPLVFARERARLVVEGTAAWQDVGPLSYVVFPLACNALPLPVVDGVLPPVPVIGCVQVRDRDGDVLWSDNGVALASRAADGALVVALPPPQELPVRVVDVDGKPAADVELVRGFDVTAFLGVSAPGGAPWAAAWRPLGRTGADGVARVRVAVAVANGKVTEELAIEARRPERVAGKSGMHSNGQACSGNVEVTPPDGVLLLQLAAFEPVRVHPASAHTLTILGMTTQALFQCQRAEGPVRVDVGADGKGVLPLARDVNASRVARVERTGEATGWAVVEPEEAGSFVYAVFRSLRVQVLDPGGGPARGRRLVLTPWNEHTHWPGLDVPMSLDAGGRVNARVGRGSWFLWCSDGANADWRFVGDDTMDLDVALELRPIPRASVRVLDLGGVPEVGTVVHCAPANGFVWQNQFQWQNQQTYVQSHLMLRQKQIDLAATGHHVTDAEGQLHFLELPLPKARPWLQYEFGATQNWPIRGRVNLDVDESVDVVHR
jgi:hypothetical protein